jgi:hypothetical protein
LTFKVKIPASNAIAATVFFMVVFIVDEL